MRHSAGVSEKQSGRRPASHDLSPSPEVNHDDVEVGSGWNSFALVIKLILILNTNSLSGKEGER
jgi:hypothetical protein